MSNLKIIPKPMKLNIFVYIPVKFFIKTGQFCSYIILFTIFDI